jgi:hypothetical protein
MTNSLCGKVVHTSEEAAEPQQASLADRHGQPPNIYKCEKCSAYLGQDIWHVGYGLDAEKLSKTARRLRTASSYRKRKQSKRELNDGRW